MFEWVGFMGKADYALECGWAASNQLKALLEQRLTSSKGEGILPADILRPGTATSALP